MAKIRVLIVDDSDDFRSLVRGTLGEDDRFEIVAEAGDGVEAISMALRHRPDLVLLDLSMPGMDGFEAISGIRSMSPRSVIVACSSYDHAFGEDAVNLGADHHISKKLRGTALIESLAMLAGKPSLKARDGVTSEWIAPYMIKSNGNGSSERQDA